jgi:hypothetical protein
MSDPQGEPAVSDELLEGALEEIERLRTALTAAEELSRQLSVLAGEMRANSERWFPELHDSGQDLRVFYALGMSGEVGEVANEVRSRSVDTGQTCGASR